MVVFVIRMRPSGATMIRWSRLHDPKGERMPTATMSPAEIKQAVVVDVRAFARGSRQRDDMTVVVVKVLSAPE
jgi:serine phosphatase RsbU (regulator of sigma subunit)